MVPNTSIQFFYLSLLAQGVLSIPFYTPRDSATCFITGSGNIPADILSSVSSISNTITCDRSRKTIGRVPDVSTSTVSFSTINFAVSDLSPLEYALRTFQAPPQITGANLRLFERYWEVYVVTEAGVRSEGGDVKIQVPRLFLEMQIARIKDSLGIHVPDGTVDNLVGKILSLSIDEDPLLLDLVTAIGGQYSQGRRQRPMGVL